MIDNKPEFLATISKKIHEILPTKYLPRSIRHTTLALITAVGITGCGDTQVKTCKGTVMPLSQIGEEVYNAGFRISGDLIQGSLFDPEYNKTQSIEAWNRASCPGYDTQIVVNNHQESYNLTLAELRKKGFDGATDVRSIERAAMQLNVK